MHDFDHPENITKNIKGTQSNVMMTFKFYESKSEIKGLKKKIQHDKISVDDTKYDNLVIQE